MFGDGQSSDRWIKVTKEEFNPPEDTTHKHYHVCRVCGERIVCYKPPVRVFRIDAGTCGKPLFITCDRCPDVKT